MVCGMDRSWPQIQFAHGHCAQPPAAFCMGDALSLPFRNEYFDLCVCGLGLNFLPDAVAGLREMARVTRPGETIAVYVWDYAGEMKSLREFWDVARAVDPEAEAHDQARRFPVCSQEGLQSAFQFAGFSSLASRNLDITTRFASFEEYWAGFQLKQGSAPVYLASRSERVREAIREGLEAALPVQPDGSIVLSARALAQRARRPHQIL